MERGGDKTALCTAVHRAVKQARQTRAHVYNTQGNLLERLYASVDTQTRRDWARVLSRGMWQEEGVSGGAFNGQRTRRWSRIIKGMKYRSDEIKQQMLPVRPTRDIGQSTHVNCSCRN